MTTAEDTLAPIVVISDDDDQLVRALCAQLTRAGAWAVPDMSSNVQNISKMVHPSLVVLDLSQQRWGVDLLKELKADPATQNIPVVVLSSNTDAAIREQCLSAGAEAYVEKPFDVSFVVEIARKAAAAARERTLKVSGPTPN